jgi:hypothetical protein
VDDESQFSDSTVLVIMGGPIAVLGLGGIYYFTPSHLPDTSPGIRYRRVFVLEEKKYEYN